MKRQYIEHSRIQAWSQRNATTLRPALILYKTHLQHSTVVLRPLVIFLLDIRALNDPLFRVDWSKDLLKKALVYPAWFDRVNALAGVCCARADSFFVPVL